MTRMVDCVVSYFGLDENDRPTFRRYFCYHIVAYPGPAEGSGCAMVATLSVHDEHKRCDYCERLHTVETGGPEAALAAAVRHLDSWHENDHMQKVQSDLRGFGDGPSAAAARFANSALQQINFPDWTKHEV
jgi:hypothetical protein